MTRTRDERSGQVHRMCHGLLFFGGFSAGIVAPPRHSYAWETICSAPMTSRIVKRHFSASLVQASSCDLFLVDGVPAAAILFDSCDEQHSALANGFFLNKGLLLMFDAARDLPSEIAARYGRLAAAEQALNWCDFVAFTTSEHGGAQLVESRQAPIVTHRSDASTPHA